MICRLFVKNIICPWRKFPFQESVSYRKRTVPFLQELLLGGIHILHNRKKTILITFFISICIAGIPLSILLLIQRYNCRVLKQTVSAYEAEQNAYVDTNVYLLSKALPAGEALTKDDLTSCTVKLPRSQSILYASDSKNLIGQYAKTALKKGQLLTADFFLFG